MDRVASTLLGSYYRVTFKKINQYRIFLINYWVLLKTGFARIGAKVNTLIDFR